MKTRTQNLKHSKNPLNSFYLKCKNCGCVIPPLFGYLSKNDDMTGLCSCKNPIPDGIIYIDKIKD